MEFSAEHVRSVESRRPRLEVIPAFLLMGLAGAFFCVRSWHGLWFLPFVDESEHLVGGWMLDHGGILYRTFVDAHGPVIFMLVQAYGAVFGWADPNWARMISVVMAAGASVAVLTSAPSASVQSRLWSMAMFIWLLSTVWLVQAIYMVSYHAVAGFLMAGGLAMFVFPLWSLSAFGRVRPVLAGFCFALVVCTAYSFAPAVVFLTASATWSARRQGRAQDMRGLIAGLGLGVALVTIWLLRFGDFIGYFVFHFAANQFVYARYVSFSWTTILSGLVPSLDPRGLAHSLSLICWTSAFAMFLWLDRVRARAARSMAGPIVLGFLGLLSLCARGGTMFQDGCFVVSAFATVSIAAAATIESLLRSQRGATRVWSYMLTPVFLLACLAGAEAVMRKGLVSPFDIPRSKAVLVPRLHVGLSDDPEYQRIRALTAPDDRILALPYSPYVFLMSGRMPMDRYTVYLPWDADYAKAPWLGVKRDLCVDMGKAPPKLVYFNHWVVWNRWAMEDYAPCFTHMLATDYVRQADFPNLYVRKR